jgi:hypothetical protein
LAEPDDPATPLEPPPQTEPAAAPGATLWAPIDDSKGAGGPPGPPGKFTRVVEAVAWIVGAAAVLFFGRIFAIVNASPPLTAYELGRSVGTIVFAVVIGVFVRWLVIRVRRRGRLFSPWILLVAVLVLVINLGRGAGIAAPPGLPIGTYLKIDAPYALTAATAEEVGQFGEALAEADAFEARRVVDNGQVVGFLVVADVNLPASPDWDDIERGFESTSGASSEQDIVGTRPALVGTAARSATVIWVESPYILTVVALDEESARVLAESVMASYE